MSTESFSPPPANPADGTATIVPVTPEMMEHAAHEAAAQADAAAHAPPEAPHAASGADAAGVPVAGTAAAPRETVGEPAAAAPEPSDLAFVHAASAGAPGRNMPAGPLSGFGLFAAKALEIAAANVAAAGAHASALLSATSVGEAAAVNAEHLRRAFDTFAAQGRELMIIGQTVVIDAARAMDETRREP